MGPKQLTVRSLSLRCTKTESLLSQKVCRQEQLLPYSYLDKPVGFTAFTQKKQFSSIGLICPVSLLKKIQATFSRTCLDTHKKSLSNSRLATINCHIIKFGNLLKE